MHRKLWNKVASDINFNLEIDTKYFSQHIPLDSQILDFGCGYGRVSKHLWELGYKNLIGIDVSEKMIERGNRKFPEITLKILKDELLPFDDNSFDAVVICAVFTCITSKEIRQNQIKELFRILKPKGKLHMVEFCSNPNKSFVSSMGIPMLYSTPQELNTLANEFKLLKTEVIETNTIGGNHADCYSLFAQKYDNHESKIYK